MMLVLSRLCGQRVFIGEPPNQIVVRVVRIHANEVKLSFDGPREIPIRREEVPPKKKTAIDEIGGDRLK